MTRAFMLALLALLPKAEAASDSAARSQDAQTESGASPPAPKRAGSASLTSQLAPPRNRHDGVYGRFEGDLHWQVALGTGYQHAAAGASDDIAVRTRSAVHYFGTLGPWLSVSTHPVGLSRSSRFNLNDSSFAFGLELKPLFWPRWALDLEQGPPAFDLTLDSLSVAVGPYWTKSSENGTRESRGWRYALRGGIPLSSSAAGLWLMGQLNLSTESRRGGDARGGGMLFLAWHGFAKSPWLTPAR